MGKLLAALIAETAPLATLATTATLTPSRPEGSQESQQSQRVRFADGESASMVALLTMRDRLHRLAHVEGIHAELIDRLHEDDLIGCAGLPDDTLTAYVRALRDADLRKQSKVPPDETARALCRSCGPVWLHPDVAAVAPVIDGWPRVLGCPWCHVKNRQTIPRPPAKDL